jgi:hypothetical protein
MVSAMLGNVFDGMGMAENPHPTVGTTQTSCLVAEIHVLPVYGRHTVSCYKPRYSFRSRICLTHCLQKLIAKCHITSLFWQFCAKNTRLVFQKRALPVFPPYLITESKLGHVLRVTSSEIEFSYEHFKPHQNRSKDT